MTHEIDEYDHYDEFDPVLYLNNFYNTIGSEGYGILHFLHEVFVQQAQDCKVLEFGGGPTIIGIMSAARIASEIHFAEYIPANRMIVQRWVDGDSSDFDWSPYFHAVLELEGQILPTEQQHAELVQQVRDKVTKVIHGDIYQRPPVATDMQYDVVMSHYCLDSVAGNYEEWLGFIKNLSSLLRSGGTIVLSTLQEVDLCHYRDIVFHNIYLDKEKLAQSLIATGFDPDSIYLDSAASDDLSERGYPGVLFASAVKL
jgi:hypothetical protein